MSLVCIEFESLNPSQQWNISKGLEEKRVNENASVIELNPNRKLPRWLEVLFYGSVGFSLFFSAFLLFSIFKFLVDPFWMDKITAVAKSLWLAFIQ
jgi:hypothetical protein